MQKPSIGRIVQYKLTEQDAQAINRRRSDARDRTKAGSSVEQATGFVAHTGNDVRAGDVFPLVITRVWNTDPGTINGQTLLDGNDTFWVTSAVPGDGERQYAWPERV